MGVTIGELVEDSNQFYQTGIIFDPNFYKDRIGEGRFTEVITDDDLNRAWYAEAFIETVNRVTTIAPVIIPAITTFSTGGLSAGVGLFLLSVCCGFAAIEPENDGKRKPHVFEQIKFNANLFACLDKQDQNVYMMKKILIPTVFKTFLYSMMKTNVFNLSPERFASFTETISSITIFFSGAIYAEDLFNFLLLGVEEYFERVRLPDLENEIHSQNAHS